MADIAVIPHIDINRRLGLNLGAFLALYIVTARRYYGLALPLCNHVLNAVSGHVKLGQVLASE